MWKEISKYEGYAVNEKGEIKRLEHTNRWNNIIKEKILPLHTCSKGYTYANIRKDNKRKAPYIHIIVWEAFKGIIPKGYKVRHINRNKEDNRLENLYLKRNLTYGMKLTKQVYIKATSKEDYTTLTDERVEEIRNEVRMRSKQFFEKLKRKKLENND